MKKTILSVLLALASATPALAASVVPPGQQPEQQQDPDKQIMLLTTMTMNPVYQAYKKDCEDGGGTWTQSPGNTLSWACRNSAGKFGIDGLPPGQQGVPLTFLAVSEANKETKTIRYSVYLDGHLANVTAVLVKGGTPNKGEK